MSLTSVNALSIFAAESNDRPLQSLFQPIDVEVSAGEFLDVKEFAARLIKIALGTTDAAQVEDFLAQSNFKLDELPARLQENERTFYRFEPDAKFLKSIESFKQTGRALPLADSKDAKTTANGNEKIAVSQNAANTASASVASTRVRQQIVVPPRIASPQIVSTAPGAPSRSDFNPADWHKVELSPQDFIASASGKNGRTQTKVSVADGDPRAEMYRAAIAKLYGGKFSDETINKLLENRIDDNSVYYVGTNNAQSKENVIKNLEAALKAGKPYDFYIHKGNTEQLMRSEIETHGSTADKLQLKISDSLTAIDEKYAKIEVANPLHASVLALQKESEKKAAIDALTAASSIDFRSNGTDAERYANQTADLISTVTHTLIDANPLYSALPEAAKNELVKGTLGFLRGGYSVYQTAKGVNDFVNDGLTDSALSVLQSTGLDKQIGIDAAKVQTVLNEKRQQEAQFVQAISNMGTAEMSRGDAALAAKIKAGLSIKPYDLPNWTAKGGELTAKALPYIALGVATGGASLPVQVAVSATGTGALGLGENYSLTRQHASAIKAGGMAAAQGAVAPLTARLGVAGDLSAGTVFTVALGKLEGKSDAEIFQDAVLQNTLSLSMQAGTAAHTAVAAKLGKTQFSAAEAQTALKAIFREELGAQAAQQTKAAIKQIEVEVVAEHLSKGGTLSTIKDAANARLADLQGAGNQLKARLQTARQEIIANYGKDNRLVTREQYAAADRRIQNRLRTAEGVEYRNSGVPLNSMPDVAVKAAYHVEAGAKSFAEFSKVMIGEFGASIKPHLAALYKEATHRFGVSDKASETSIQQHRLNEAADVLPSGKRPTITAEADGSVKIGRITVEGRTAEIKLTTEQLGKLSEAQLKQLTRVTGLAEKSLQFEKVMTDNRASARTERTKLFEQMAKLEAADASLSKVFEPVWEKVARAQEQADGGHSVDRHGAQLSDAELVERLTQAKTPTSGVITNAPPNSTRFSSFKDWVLTRNAAFEEVGRQFSVDLSKPPAPGQDTKFEIFVEYNRAIDEGFAGVGTKTPLVDAAGNPILKANGQQARGFTTTDPIDGITRTKTALEWNATEQKWQVKQHYPDADKWNNATKTYDPNKLLHTSVLLP